MVHITDGTSNTIAVGESNYGIEDYLWSSGPNAGQPAPITPATVRRPDDHLLCYKAKLAKKQIEQQGCGALVPGDRGVAFSPKQVAADAPKGLHVADQFGQGQLDQSKLKEICLPATVELPS